VSFVVVELLYKKKEKNVARTELIN